MQSNKVWLNGRKITDSVLSDFNISGDVHIVIPVNDIYGNFSFNKYRRSPLDDTGTKYWYDAGGKVTLYGGFKAFSEGHDTILIVEGEMDCLVAWSHNIPAVTSTGGALSFQKEWAMYFDNKEVVICLDNDIAGAQGTVKILKMIPHAKVMFLPHMANVKDISDYVSKGGDLNTLMRTSQQFKDIEEVKDDMGKKIAKCEDVYFHEAYIEEHTKKVVVKTKREVGSDDDLQNAKLYPVTNLLEFGKNGKAICPFHNEKSGSLHLYKNKNTTFCFGACWKPYDSINIYMKQNGCTLPEAIKELNKI